MSMHFMTGRPWRLAAGFAIGAIALLVTACGDDGDAEPQPSPSAAAASTSVATAPSTPSDRRAPTQLPARTPVSIDYEIVDPGFDALPGARAFHGEHEGAGYQI